MRDALGEVQSILVLGGGSDIGRAVCRRLNRGRLRRVVLAGRPEDGMEPIAQELRDAGVPTVEVVHWDATEVENHEGVIAGIFDHPQDIDFVFVPAGLLGDQAAFEADPVSAAKVAQVNYGGLVCAGLVVASHLRRQGHGVMAFMSSVAGVRARRDNFVYGSTKAGLDAFAQGLGDSLVGTGVRVMVIRPGFVHTKMTEGMQPAPFSTTPEKVADLIADGLLKGSEVVWAPPVLAYLFLVLRLLPRKVWRMVADRG